MTEVLAAHRRADRRDAPEQESDAASERSSGALPVSVPALLGGGAHALDAFDGLAAPSLRRRGGGVEDPLGGRPLDSAVEESLQRRRGRGAPLPDELGSELSEGFGGADLSAVRVHHDPEAGQIAGQLQAQAFTHGNDIYFAPGAYQPGSASGRELLAHEAAHVVQQRSGRVAGGSGGGTLVGRADDPLEAEADALGAAALQRRPAAHLLGATTPAGAGPVRRRLVSVKTFDADSSETLAMAGTAKKHLLRLLGEYGDLAGVPAGGDTVSGLLDRHAEDGTVVGKAVALLAEMVGTIDKWIEDHQATDADTGTVVEDGSRKNRRNAFIALRGAVQNESDELVAAFAARQNSLPGRQQDADKALLDAEQELDEARKALDEATTKARPYEESLARARAKLEAARRTAQSKAAQLESATKDAATSARSNKKVPEQLAAKRAELQALEDGHRRLDAEKQASRQKSFDKKKNALAARILELEQRLADQQTKESARDTAATELQEAQSAEQRAADRETRKANRLAPKAEAKRLAEERHRNAVEAEREASDDVDTLEREKSSYGPGSAPTGGAVVGAFSTAEGKEVEEHYDDKMDASGRSSFTKLGGMIDTLVGSNGDEASAEATVDIPVDPHGVGMVGLGLSLKLSKDDGLVKVRAEISLRAGAQFAMAGKIMGAAGGFIESAGGNGAEAAELLSYALYRRMRESNAVPSEISNRAWGGNWGKLGYVRADAWSRDVETRIIGNPGPRPADPGPSATDDEKAAYRAALKAWRIESSKKYVVSGGLAAVQGEIGPDLPGNMSVGAKGSVKGTVGSRIDAISLQDKGGAGKQNQKSTGMFAQLAKQIGGPDRGADRSVARLDTGLEMRASAKFGVGFPPFGSVAVEGEGVGTMGWTATGHRHLLGGGKNPEHELELTSGKLEISGAVTVPSAPGVSMLLEEVTSLLTKKVVDALPAYWEKANVQPSVILAAMNQTTTGGKVKEVVGGILGSTSVGAELKNVSPTFTQIGSTGGYQGNADQGHKLKITIGIDWIARETSIAFSRANDIASLSLPGFVSARVGTEKRIAKITHKWT
jgi:hypothetical protein